MDELKEPKKANTRQHLTRLIRFIFELLLLMRVWNASSRFLGIKIHFLIFLNHPSTEKEKRCYLMTPTHVCHCQILLLLKLAQSL